MVNSSNLPWIVQSVAISCMGIKFPTLLEDPRQRFGYERPAVMPTTVVLDHQLNVKAVLVGPQTEDDLHAALK